MKRRTLPRHMRLTREGDFKAVYQARHSAADARLILYTRPNGLGDSRLGLSVGGRWGNSVLRNRFRRLCREAFRLSRHELPAGYDYIVIPRRTIDLSLDELTESLRKLTSELSQDSAQRHG